MNLTLTGLLQPEVMTDGDAAHAAYLQVGDQEVGRLLIDYASYGRAGPQLTDLRVVVLKGRADFGKNTWSIGHDEDVRHARRVPAP
jgi:hypothetical protein